jgi:transcriptional regulator with XRE-family HTH domain
MDVGTEVKLEAVRQGLQLGSIAKNAGMKRPYFSARVNGHREFSPCELSRIGQVLGVPAWELLRRAEEHNSSALADSTREKVAA